jgi:hypothetical protein
VGDEVVVPGHTFDDLYSECFGDKTVDVCKIDVEKAEYEILDAPGHNQLRRCRFLFIEIHDVPDRRPAQIVDTLGQFGYVLLPRASDPSIYLFRNAQLDTKQS